MAKNQQIYEKHKVLYHYTTASGLKGILDRHTLWATHYKFLNDTSEIEHMKRALIERVIPVSKEVILEYFRSSLTAKKKIRESGGVNTLANDEAKNIIDSLYRVTFEVTEIGTPFAVPFIASFCGHGEDETYVQENGLLSQWRSYGEGGGFAIVFDTKKLCELMKNEDQFYSYSAGSFAEVVYDGDDEEFREEFTELVEMLQDMVREMMRGRQPEVGGLFGPFVNSVSRFKHRGFKEEREVRIIASPTLKETIEEIKRSEAAEKLADKCVKEIRYRDRNGGNVPYIELFESVEMESLPITKIIIGPGREQQASETKLRTIVGKNDVEIHCSETPYVPSK